jgi:peptidoglycan/LPS O-acetylase OafA/YrhL
MSCLRLFWALAWIAMMSTATVHRATEVAPPPAFRPDVEGLRAVAVAVVVLFHAGVPGLGGGYVGVDVFFVISGFLITSLMRREIAGTGRLSLRDFYARRARRILPAAGLVLVTVILAAYHWLGFLRGDEIARDGVWAALFASNFRFAALGIDYLGSQAAPSPLQHFWSLAVEEQYYLVWPLAVALLIRFGRGRWIGAGLGVAVAASFAWSAGSGGYFAPATRAWEIGAGGLLAIAGRRLPAAFSWLGLALIGLAVLGFDETTRFPGYAAALPVAGALLVLAGRGDALLGLAPLRWLGRVSYSLYLWHWPVLIIWAQAHGGPLGVPARALAVLLSLALAVLTYTCVEDPVRRSGRLKRSHLLTLAVAVLLIATPVAVAEYRIHTSPATDHGPEFQPRLGAPGAN